MLPIRLQSVAHPAQISAHSLHVCFWWGVLISMKWADVLHIPAQAIRDGDGRARHASSCLQAMVHRREQAGFVTAQTGFDATGHFFIQGPASQSSKREPQRGLGLCGVFLAGASSFLR